MFLAALWNKAKHDRIYKTNVINSSATWLFFLSPPVSTVIEPQRPPSTCFLRPGWILGYASAFNREHKPQIWWASPAQSQQLETLGSTWEKGTNTSIQYDVWLTAWQWSERNLDQRILDYEGRCQLNKNVFFLTEHFLTIKCHKIRINFSQCALIAATSRKQIRDLQNLCAFLFLIWWYFWSSGFLSDQQPYSETGTDILYRSHPNDMCDGVQTIIFHH